MTKTFNLPQNKLNIKYLTCDKVKNISNIHYLWFAYRNKLRNWSTELQYLLSFLSRVTLRTGTFLTTGTNLQMWQLQSTVSSDDDNSIHLPLNNIKFALYRRKARRNETIRYAYGG